MNTQTTTAISNPNSKEEQPALIRQDYPVFHILGQEIALISEMLDWGRNTAALINDKTYYLGSELPNIGTAVIAWEQANERSLTETELQLVFKDHNTNIIKE